MRKLLFIALFSFITIGGIYAQARQIATIKQQPTKEQTSTVNNTSTVVSPSVTITATAHSWSCYLC